MIEDDDKLQLNLGTMEDDDGTFSAVVSMSGFANEEDALISAEFLFSVIIKEIEVIAAKKTKKENNRKKGFKDF